MKKSTRYGLSVVLSSWLGLFCLFGYRATFAVLKIPMSADMGWTQAQVTLGYSIMMLFYAVAAFFCGLILDKFGARIVYLVGACAGAAGFILTGRCESLIGYYASYGIFAGIATGMLWVSATVSIRKWYAGATYGRMFGWAYMGAPVAQIIMCLLVQNILASTELGAWRTSMQLLGWLVFALLLIAAFFAKKAPEAYGMQPHGISLAAAQEESSAITLRSVFTTYPIWAAIGVFLFSMLAEFLVWAQIVSYWKDDLGMPLSRATHLYVTIGVAGLFAMPMMGIFADRIASISTSEAQGRKRMLIMGPVIGACACLLLLLMQQSSLLLGIVVCVLFAVYWAVVPGGVVGYAGSVYGRLALGKIWGLATLIVMGIGPFVGPLIGGYLKDVAGSYRPSIIVALSSFLLSAILAMTLPTRRKKL